MESFPARHSRPRFTKRRSMDQQPREKRWSRCSRRHLSAWCIHLRCHSRQLSHSKEERASQLHLCTSQWDLADAPQSMECGLFRAIGLCTLVLLSPKKATCKTLTWHRLGYSNNIKREVQNLARQKSLSVPLVETTNHGMLAKRADKGSAPPGEEAL